MPKTNAHVIEVVEEPELRKKAAKAREAVKRFFPNAGPLRLYRSADGRIGVQLDLRLWRRVIGNDWTMPSGPS